MNGYYHQQYSSQGAKLIPRAAGLGKPSLAAREDNAIQDLVPSLYFLPLGSQLDALLYMLLTVEQR